MLKTQSKQTRGKPGEDERATDKTPSKGRSKEGDKGKAESDLKEHS